MTNGCLANHQQTNQGETVDVGGITHKLSGNLSSIVLKENGTLVIVFPFVARNLDQFPGFGQNISFKFEVDTRELQMNLLSNFVDFADAFETRVLILDIIRNNRCVCVCLHVCVCVL